MTEIRHSLPSIGQTTIKLFPPADQIYALLIKHKEIPRLNMMRHLGVLSYAHPGTRLARFDYVAAMLHYAERLAPLAGTNKFRLGGVEFSSSLSALQAMALVWNIGHLAGTFGVEKGVFRFLKESAPRQPTKLLRCVHRGLPAVDKFMDEADEYLLKNDYSAFCRVNSVIKLLNWSAVATDWNCKFALEFLWPMIGGRTPEPSPRWNRLKELFLATRHVAYLTLDCPFTGLPWLPQFPALVEQLLGKRSEDCQAFLTELSEIVSPVERVTFDSIYFSTQGREATVFQSDLVVMRLRASTDPEQLLHEWQRLGLLRDLKLGKSGRKLQHVGCARVRSHFHSEGIAESDFESDLRESDISHPIASKYTPWTSTYMLEPVELLLDIFVDRVPRGSDIGCLILWIMRRCERLNQNDVDPSFELILRTDLASCYRELLERAAQLLLGNVSVRIDPWDLGALGVRIIRSAELSNPGVMAAASSLSDTFTLKLLKRYRVSLTPDWEDRAAELEGLRNLRSWLRAGFKKTVPRRRWLIVPASITIRANGKDVLEFDGGMLEISSRTGRLTWWGLETKNGAGNPRKILTRKIAKLGISAEVCRIKRKHAVAKIELN